MTFKKNVLPALAITVIGFSILTVTPVFAETKTDNTLSGLVSFIAKTFNLDQSKVESAVKQYRQQNQQKRQQEAQSREQKKLDQLVKSGKITEEQKQKILAELKVLREKYNPAEYKNLTAEQRKQKMAEEKAEIEKWAKDNNIDAKYLMPGFGGFGFKGQHKGFLKPDVSSIPNR